MRHFICAVAAVALSVASAEAQDVAGTFDQLRVLVKPGDTVSITDSAGLRVRGRLTDISPTSLGVDVSGKRREFLQLDIDRIARKGDDSLANGALIGLAIGAGLGAAVLGTVDDGPGAGWVAFASVLYGGIGAGIGVGVDALVRGERVIFAAPRRSASAVDISPILGHRRKGLAVSLRLGR